MTVVKLKETSMKKILLTALMVCAVTACSEKEPSVQKAVPPSSGPNLTQTPDVGKVELVAVKANGTGITPGAAINDALKMAVTQINGVHIESISANLTAVANLAANLDVETSSKSKFFRGCDCTIKWVDQILQGSQDDLTVIWFKFIYD